MHTRIKIAGFVAADAAHVEKTLEALPKVTSVRVEPAPDRAIVEHDGAATQDMLTALRQLGYDPAIEGTDGPANT